MNGARAQAMEPFAKVCVRCGSRYDAAASFCQKDGAALRLLDEERDARIGQVLLDQFRIEEKIGVGGMGAVYRARQTTLGRDVAIKILHPDLASNPDAVRRFHREARISTALDHPNVVRVFLFGQLPDGSLYIVMELLRGRTLAELLRVERPLPVHRALHIATQVSDGVGEAHSQGIVHRDVKPENVFLITKGRDPDFVKVLDFGIARVLRGEDATSATQSGLVFGTARYISPEGAAGERTDARSDVYSLGVMAYQLLAGETPFDGSAPVTLLMKHIHDPAPHILTRPGGAQVPAGIADVVMRALSKNPEGRFEDAAEFAEVLRGAAQRAGFDVIRMRTGTSGIGAGERRDPSGPLIREPRERASTVPRTVALQAEAPARPPPSSGTLENAPSPFGGATGHGSMAGMRPSAMGVGARLKSPLATVALAFVVGAIAVASGAWVVHALTSDPVAEEATDLVRRAEIALAAGHLDAPPDQSVLALTDRLLEIRPNDPDAIRIRRAAADRFVEQAQQAEHEHREPHALSLYNRALHLAADDRRAIDAIDRLERAGEEDARAAGIAVEPAPMAGEPTMLTATIANGVELEMSDRPRFVVLRGRRRVGAPLLASPGSAEGTFTVTFTFPQAGRYHLKFVAGEDDRHYEIESDVDVARSPRAPATGGDDDDEPPAVTTFGAAEPVGQVVPQIVEVPPPDHQQISAVQARPPPISPQTQQVAPPPPILPLAPRPDPPQQQGRRPDPSPPPPWTSGGH